MNQRMIKFRAWDIDLKRMSTIVHLGDGIVCFPNDTLPIAFFATRTERFVFRQYTGLNDKDGQEIYEGDITKDIEGGIGVVEFKATSFRAVDGLGWDNLAHPDECEVIGNIYQNPELLQQ